MSVSTIRFLLALVVFNYCGPSQHYCASFQGETLLGDVRDGWLCPVAEDIQPCICSVTETGQGSTLLIMDCSNVESEEQLRIAFQAIFPSRYFDIFVIEQEAPVQAMTQLSDGIFNGAYFDVVKVTGTAIENIGDNVFADSYGTLTSLYLNDNEISLFPFESLANFVKLTSLNLDGNHILVLPQIESDSLLTLSLSRNFGLNIKTSNNLFEKIPYIRKVVLQQCGLTDLNGIFSNGQQYIELIDVSHNELTTLPTNAFTFGYSSASTSVFFSFNKINSVSPNFAVGLKSTGILLGNENSLKFIYEDQWESIFQAVGPNGIINLKGNSLYCGCEEAWIITNSSYMNAIYPLTDCYDGTVFRELNSAVYEKHCSTNKFCSL